MLRRSYRLLAVLPVLAILGAPWFANRIEPRIFGLPFLLAWIAGSVLASSVVMWIIGVIDAKAEARSNVPWDAPRDPLRKAPPQAGDDA